MEQRSRSMQLLAAALLLALAAGGCGGQSGAEGDSGRIGPGIDPVGPGASCVEQDVTELPFDVSWFDALVLGTHESTLRWNDSADKGEPAPIAIEVERRSVTRTTLRCGGVARIEVDARVRVDGSREVLFRGWATGDQHGATLNALTELSAWKQLKDPGPPPLVGEDLRGLGVFAFLSEDGMRGTLAADAGSTGPCTRATWPASRTCEVYEREVAADTQFGGFEFSQAFETVRALPALALTWEDGSATELELTVEGDSETICAGQPGPADVPLEWRGTRLASPARVHLRTADGALDVVMSARLEVRWSEGDGWFVVPSRGPGDEEARVRISGRGFARAGDLPIARDLPEEALVAVELSLSRGLDRVSGRLDLSHFETGLEPQLAASGEPLTVIENPECLDIRRGSRTIATGTYDASTPEK